jgi:hypothetical protein
MELQWREREFEIARAASQKDNIEKIKLIDKLTFDLHTARDNANEVTTELDALRQKLDLMEQHYIDLVKDDVVGRATLMEQHYNDLVKEEASPQTRLRLV